VVLIGSAEDRVAPYARLLADRGVDVSVFREAPPSDRLRAADCAVFLDWGWSPGERSHRRAGIVAALVEARCVRILRACSATEADRVLGRLLP